MNNNESKENHNFFPSSFTSFNLVKSPTPFLLCFYETGISGHDRIMKDIFKMISLDILSSIWMPYVPKVSNSLKVIVSLNFPKHFEEKSKRFFFSLSII